MRYEIKVQVQGQSFLEADMPGLAFLDYSTVSIYFKVPSSMPTARAVRVSMGMLTSLRIAVCEFSVADGYRERMVAFCGHI